MADARDEQPRIDARAHSTPILIACAVVAAAAALARDADAVPVLPIWLSCLLQTPVVVAWVWANTRSGAGNRKVHLFFSIALIAAAAGLALNKHDFDTLLIATTLFACGNILAEGLFALYRRIDERINDPAELLRALVGPWLLLILIVTVLLTIPLATDAAVPDYRHNFWQHVLNSAFGAVGAATLIGTTVYHPGEDYAFFGQVVLYLTAQLAGIGLAAVGLANIRPFLNNAVRLKTVLLAAFALQLAAILAMFGAWTPTDAPTGADRVWWGCVHAASAVWNNGFMLRENGLAGYLSKRAVFISVTTLTIAGSLGLPIIIDILKGRAATGEGSGSNRELAAVRSWRRLPQWEAGGAFIMMTAATALLWFCETPGRLPETLVPPRPIEFGNSQIALRDDMNPGARWSLAVYVSATIRSAGMQSTPMVEGSVSWPSFALLMAWMIVGGSAGGVAGGLRATSLLLFAICMLAAGSNRTEARHRVLRAIGLFIPMWLAVNLVAVGLLAAATDGDWYELAFESVAAVNSVGLSTGLSVHLTWTGRLAMILIMLTGRVLPLLFWSHIALQVKRDISGGRVDRPDSA